MTNFNLKDEELRGAVKEGIKEWCKESLQEFGWFSLKTLVVLGISGLLYLALISSGWHKG